MKKLIALLLVLCVLTGVVFARFRSDRETVPDGTESGQSAPENLALVSERTMLAQYNENYYPFSGEYTVTGVARLENRLLIAGTGPEKDILGLAEYTVEVSGQVTVSAPETISLDDPGEANEARIYDITAGGDGSFYVLTGNAPEAYTGEFAILRYDADGSFLDKMTVSDFPEKAGRELSFAAGKEGELVLMGLDYVYFLLWQGQPTNRQSVERAYFTSAVSTDMGIVLSAMHQLLDASPFYLVDSRTGDLSQLPVTNNIDPAVDMEGFITLWGGSGAPVQGLQGEYISNSGDSFVLFDFSGDSQEKLLQWNFDSSVPGPACRLSETAFICVIPGSGALLLTGMAEVPYVEKSTVNVALVGLNSDKTISAMNLKSQEYAYQAIQYNEDEMDRFLTDLVAGKTVDLVLFGDCVNTASAYFEDLYPYIDRDPDLSRESFLPHLLESTEVNGQLHQLWDQVGIWTLTGKSAYVGDGQGLTPADYLCMVAEHEELKGVFDTFVSRDVLLGYVANVGINSFVDKAAGLCHFDDEAFSELLEWCISMGPDIPEGSNAPSYAFSEYILSPAWLLEPVIGGYSQLYGGRMAYVGFPNGGEGFHYYSHVYGSLTMAIPSNSQNKAGAWAFIKDRLSMENQLAVAETPALPVLYEVLARLVDKSSDEAGRNAFYELLPKIQYAEMYGDDALRDIILSSGQGYINGDKSLEETVALIQSRASIYVAEQYG